MIQPADKSRDLAINLAYGMAILMPAIVEFEVRRLDSRFSLLNFEQAQESAYAAGMSMGHGPFCFDFHWNIIMLAVTLAIPVLAVAEIVLVLMLICNTPRPERRSRITRLLLNTLALSALVLAWLQIVLAWD